MAHPFWKTKQSKHGVYRELAQGEEPLPASITYEDDDMIHCVCPYCQGNFGVDATYIDQVTEFCHCPICCTQVYIPEPLA